MVGLNKFQTVFYIDLSVSEVNLESGTIYTCFIRNISEQKKLLNSIKELEKALDSAAIVSKADKSGKLTYVNQKFCVVSKYSEKELLGNTPALIKSGRHSQAFYKRLWNMILSGKTWVGELENKAKDGTPYWVNTTIVPTKDPRGEIVGFIDISHLSTKQKLAEQALEESLRESQETNAILEKVNLELDRFVYTASHDLKVPLRGISSFSNFLKQDYAHLLDEKGCSFLDRIISSSLKMDQLIEDLLTLSRVSRIENPYEDIKINYLLEKVMERLEYDINSKQVNIEIQENMSELHCDRIKMEEVFMNLINNAIKFSSKITCDGKLPKVEIFEIENQYYYEIHVKDNGIGIQPNYHEEIFDMFKRLHTYSQYEVTGAGLYIVKKVLEEHGGGIRVVSDGKSGSTFVLTIQKNL